MSKKITFLLGVLFIAISCGTKNSKDSFTVSDTFDEYLEDSLFLDSTETLSDEIPVYRATETVLTDLIHTKLEVNFDWQKARMNGVETLTAKPHFYPSDSLILDAKGMDILQVQLDAKDLTYTYDSSYLRIKLNRIYTRNENYTIVIRYVAKPDERTTGGSAAITSDKGLYFINPKGEDKSKMPQIWTQGETEASSVWFPTIDSPNMKTTQELLITVDNNYATLSNGKLVSSKKNANGTRTDHWKQDLPHAPYLFMMGVGEFKVVKDTYTRPDGSKMEVNYYVEPEWENYAKAIFGETPNMIKFFSQKLGVEYPWDKYSQIVVRDYVSGAMENTGAVIFGDYVYKNDRELLDGNDQSTIAHELFHHWFGDLVTCESWSNLPLNESFANYSQYLWDEHRYGLDEADYQAEAEADGYFQSAQMQGYHDLIWFDYDDKEQMFDGHSYNKGGRILHMLRNYLGDDAFFAGIKNYLTINKFKPAEFHQLRLAFEEVSGEDLNWFFNQWFLGSGHPVLDVKQSIDASNGKVVLTIKQNQSLDLSPIYKLPVEVAIHDNQGRHIHKIVVDKVEQSFELPFAGNLKCLVFDQQQVLLSKTMEEKPAEQYLFQYYNETKYKARKEAILMGSKTKDPQVQQLILDALKDPFWNIRLVALEKAVKLKEVNKEKGIALIKDMSVNDPNSQVRASALNFLVNNMNGDELTSLCIDRIEKDQSYLVVSAALKNLAKQNPEKAMEKASVLEKEKSAKMIAGIAQLYGAHGDKEKYDFFVNALSGGLVQGFDQLGVMNSFTYFLSRQEPTLLNQAVSIYQNLYDQGGFYTKMFVPQNTGYLITAIDGQIQTLTEEVASLEQSNQAQKAAEAKEKIKALEETKNKYAAFEVPAEEKE